MSGFDLENLNFKQVDKEMEADEVAQAAVAPAKESLEPPFLVLLLEVMLLLLDYFTIFVSFFFFYFLFFFL